MPSSPQNSIKHVSVAAVAGETRSLDRQHGTDIACADRPDQTIEAVSGSSTARAAKIVINDLDASPAELTGAIVAEA